MALKSNRPTKSQREIQIIKNNATNVGTFDKDTPPPAIVKGGRNSLDQFI